MTTPKYYTVTAATKRVHRSRTTIETWIREGLPTTHLTLGNRTTRYITETDLLTWYRNKLRNNPSKRTNNH